MWGHGYDDMMDGFGVGGFGAMWFFWFLILVGIVALVFAVVRLASRSPRQGSDESHGGPSQSVAGGSARAILEERYARGEIDTEEFSERLSHLVGQ